VTTMTPAPAPIHSQPSGEAPLITWRDAITPLSRASRRRWTVTYALLLALLAACFLDRDIGGGVAGLPSIAILAPIIVMGMLRRATRRITALDHPELDERDIAARNSAYRVALPLLALVTIAGLILLAKDLPDITRSTHLPPPDQHEVQTLHGWFLQTRELVALGAWIGLWAIFLPTGVLAWREPDAVEPENGLRGLPDALRDALLGLALAGAVAAALVADWDEGLLLFVATLALLGALGRRRSGQPVMTRQRMWRVAVGVALIVLIVVYAAIVNSVSGAMEVQGGPR
jgi:hypothetical protein